MLTKILRVLLHSNSVNDGCIIAFLFPNPLKYRKLLETQSSPITSSLHQHPIHYTIDPIDQKLLPLTTSLQQGYSPFQYSDDPIDDMNNTLADSINA